MRAGFSIEVGRGSGYALVFGMAGAWRLPCRIWPLLISMQTPPDSRDPLLSFHRGRYGCVGQILPVDDLGFVHFTCEGWMSAPMDRRPATAGAAWSYQMVMESFDAVWRADQIVSKWRAAVGAEAVLAPLDVSDPEK